MEFLEQVDSVKANKLRWCGTWLTLRHWPEANETKVINAQLCKQSFLCEVCAVRRQAKAYAAAVPKVKALLEERPELKPVMVTYGIKTGPDLDTQFTHFAESRKKYMAAVRRGKSAKNRNSDLEFGKIAGQIRAFEVKRAKGNAEHWNVHNHVFCLVEGELDQHKISQEWKYFSKDSFIVDVTPITPKTEDADPVESGLLEVVKYPLKFEGLTPEDAWEAHQILGGRRMMDCLGDLRGVQVGPLETDAGVEEISGAYLDFIASWNWGREAFDVEQDEEIRLTVQRKGKPTRTMLSRDIDTPGG